MSTDLTITDAQREVREVYLGGSVGGFVCAVLWLTAAALGTTLGARPAILTLVLGGMFIFPATQLALRALGRRASLSHNNPMRWLAMQVAFIVPLTLPVAGAAAVDRIGWFFPACTMIVGAHYLPFAFLYGMPSYLVLAAVLLFVGLGVGLYASGSLTLAAWLTGAVFAAFGAWTAATWRKAR